MTPCMEYFILILLINFISPNVHKIFFLFELVDEELEKVEKKICSRPMRLFECGCLAIPHHLIVISHKIDIGLRSFSMLVRDHIYLQVLLLLCLLAIDSLQINHNSRVKHVSQEQQIDAK